MKFLVLLLGIIFGIENGTNNFNLRNNERALISIIAENEAEFALANCYCRIGNDVGSRVNEYPNSLKDFGHIASYGGIIVTNSMEEDCGRKCAIKAADWLNLLSNDELCNYVKKQGSQRILAYAKVGGRKWNVRGSGKSASCCGNGGAYYCPSGWEYDSNPKKCKG
ncbi:MAG: hypothetical protein IPN86_17925 [Saprospiraceae bacterium]|nr:hypothetical protein [Saprospiraceae bacterium]